MQTSSIATSSTPAFAPPIATLPKKKAARVSRDPFRRDPLACRLMDAVAPLVVDDGNYNLKPGQFEVDIYKALLPVCSSFTTADAARAYLAIHPATKALHHRGTHVDRTARVVARDVLQAFIAVSAPSRPEDVKALAEHLTLLDAYETYEPIMAQVLRPIAALSLADGVKDLLRGDFSCGETFGSAADGTKSDSWCYRVAKASGRMQWWYPSKKGAK
jgi:hypothetical protein